MRGLLLVVLVVLMGLIVESGEAQEPMVYKCLEGGQHAYQSTPCAGVELKRWVVPAQDVVGLMAGGVKPPSSQSRSKERSRRPRAPSARRLNNADVKIDACARARAGRERAYSKAGLKRDFAMSSFWDNKVHQACW